MSAPVPGYCAARPGGEVEHLLPLAVVEADPALVVVPCAAHDTPGHMFTRDGVVDLAADYDRD